MKPSLQSQPRGFRGDIQGLRAIAVTVVVLYHFWGSHLPGGFVGVDVFFVISGFLITSHLIARPPRSLPDVADFWMRRVKRLIPASFLVILFTVVGVWLIAPETVWKDWGLQALAATFYFQNWFLATNKVDYLAEGDSASPFQHFWSLSAEEQFYFVWPMLLGMLVLLSVKYRVKTYNVILTGICVIFLSSFSYSIYLTSTEPGIAYFSTFTRVWEFAAGALVAAVGRKFYGAKSDLWSLMASWVGILAIILSTLAFNGEMPFPGYIAAIPVLGTALVLLAHSVHKYSPNIFLNTRIFRFIGDNSYAIYLWHWPLLILMPYMVDEFGFVQKLATLAFTVLLAVFTQKLVEVRFRKLIDSSRFLTAPRFLLAGSLVLVLVAGGFYVNSSRISDDAQNFEANLVAAQKKLVRSVSDLLRCLATVIRQNRSFWPTRM
ncbi:acyltransferase family protein [Glutamicibacter arilaitensis]